MMEQESDLKRFNEGSTFKRGHVMTDIQRATKQKRKQMEQARSFAQLLQNQEALRMQRESEENPDYFIPGSKAGHKPTKKSKGVEGKTVGSKGRGKGKTKQPPTLNELLDKLNRVRRIDSGQEQVEDVPEEDDGLPKLGEGPEPRRVRPIKSTEQFPNPLCIVHVLYNVFICQGCPKRINSATRPPHDIFFRVKAIRPFEDKDTLIWKDQIANGYLHLDLKCLKNFDKDVNLEECQMTDEMFTNLSDAHMKVLADMGILKHIIANKQKDIQVSLLSYFQSVCRCTFFVYGKVATRGKKTQRVRSVQLFRMWKKVQRQPYLFKFYLFHLCCVLLWTLRESSVV